MSLQVLSPELADLMRAQVRERPVPPPVGERAPVEVTVAGGRVLLVEPDPDEAS